MGTKRYLQLGFLCAALSLVLVGILKAADSYALQPEASTASKPAVTLFPGTLVEQKISVPTSMRSAPFDKERTLRLPSGAAISVYARIEGARFMAVTPDNNLLVSVPGQGKVVLVRAQKKGDPLISNFATGLRKPHDMVFHTIGKTTYLYISETHQVNRYIYTNGDTTAKQRKVVVSKLPDSSTPELKGAYGHELKNIALDSKHNLYVSIASTCNACSSDTESNPVRGAIYQYDADGKKGRLFARGLRNAEGLDFLPGTNDLWVVVNNRDNLLYPFHDDSNNYGKVVPAYVDNHPPEEFTKVRDGGNYGWPFCNPNPDNGSDLMPFDLDVELNADGHVDCSTMDRINKGIQAHSAPLGLKFLQNTKFPQSYRNGAIVAYHGSWNRTQPTGYKVVYFPWDSAKQQPGNEQDLVTGWSNGKDREVWGRPVDIAVNQQGNLFISDDKSGTVYTVTIKDGATFNNKGVSSDANYKAANYDGAGCSYSAEALQTAGINKGQPLTVDDLTFTWPDTTPGESDNYKAQGQTLLLDAKSGATTLAFLGSASHGPSKGAATITYTDGTTQSIMLAFDDWTLSDGKKKVSSFNKIAAQLKYRNGEASMPRNVTTYLFYSTFTLKAGKTVSSVTLPSKVNQGGLHVFAWTIK